MLEKIRFHINYLSKSFWIKIILDINKKQIFFKSKYKKSQKKDLNHSANPVKYSVVCERVRSAPAQTLEFTILDNQTVTIAPLSLIIKFHYLKRNIRKSE